MAWLFRGPKSYTGQDLVELHVTGCPPLVHRLQTQVQQLGARQALPGEFTARAFLNGKMDLVQAEAVQNVVAAVNDVQLQAAHRLLAGTLSTKLTALMDDLADLAVLMEANIDFSEEEIELIDRRQVTSRLDGLLAGLQKLLASAVDSEGLSRLPQVLLLGPANAGKSSLMNRLSGTDRAICSPLPGTTRDILTAVWRRGRRQCQLLDGAGVGAETVDPLASEAAAMLLKQVPKVDLVLFVTDIVADEPDAAIVALNRLPPDRTVVVANKADLLAASQASRRVGRLSSRLHRPVYLVSALTGQGLDELTEAVFDRLGGGAASLGGQTLALSLRQSSALTAAAEALQRARHGAAANDTLEVLAADIRYALDEIGAILGKISDQDILNDIFSRFCIGK